VPIISCEADIDHHLKQLVIIDPRLAAIKQCVPKVPLRLREPGFAGLAQIVVAQLLSVASASAINQRLAKLVLPLCAENYLATDPQSILACGLSKAKYRTLQGIAQAESQGDLNFSVIAKLPEREAMAELCQYKGIGPWSAQVYLLFCAGHADIFPAGDLALQKAVAAVLALDERPSTKATAQIAAQWAPHRGTAARLMWAYYAVLKQREGIV